MKLFLICSILILGLPVSISSQTVSKSEQFPLHRDELVEFMGKVEDRLIFYTSRQNRHKLVTYDLQLTDLREHPINLVENRTSVMALQSSDSALHIFHMHKGKGGNYLLWAQRYNALGVATDTSLIATFERSFYRPSPAIYFSNDESKVLFFRQNGNERLDFIIYDISSQAVMYTIHIDLDKPRSLNTYKEILLTNSGELILLQEENIRKTRIQDHQLIVSHYNQFGWQQTVEVPMQELYCQNFTATFDDLNRQLVVAGFYSTMQDDRSQGSFYCRVPLFGQTAQYVLAYHPFSEDFTSNILAGQAVNKQGISYLTVQDLILRRDGGLILLAEIEREVQRFVAGAMRNTGVVSIDYFNDDLALMSIHPDGKLHWQTVLNKKQYSQDDNGMYASFALMKTSRNLRILFNDQINDVTTVSAFTIDPSGEVDRNSVLSTHNQKIKLQFRQAVQVSADELIIPSERRGRARLVSVRY